MEVIKSGNGITIAIIVRKDFNKDGINFVSEEEFPLQLGINSYEKGHEIKSHFHKKHRITVNNFQEVILIKSGKALVNLLDLTKKLVKSVTLLSGDLIFFVNGGHGLEMMEDTTFIIVRQGPFGEGNDKALIE